MNDSKSGSRYSRLHPSMSDVYLDSTGLARIKKRHSENKSLVDILDQADPNGKSIMGILLLSAISNLLRNQEVPRAEDWTQSEVVKRSMEAHDLGHFPMQWWNTVDLEDDESGEFPAQLERVQTAHPPIDAEFLLHLFLRTDERDAVIGDLIERYGKICQRLGKRRADFYAYWEVCRTFCHFVKRALLKTGLMVLLGEWVRKLTF